MIAKELIRQLLNCSDMDANVVIGTPDSQEEQVDLTSIEEDSSGNIVLELNILGD